MSVFEQGVITHNCCVSLGDEGQNNLKPEDSFEFHRLRQSPISRNVVHAQQVVYVVDAGLHWLSSGCTRLKWRAAKLEPEREEHVPLRHQPSNPQSLVLIAGISQFFARFRLCGTMTSRKDSTAVVDFIGHWALLESSGASMREVSRQPQR